MRGTLLAAVVSPDNTPHGYNLTFAFPMLMFIIVAALLYVRFRSPHRVPGQATLASTREIAPAGVAGLAGPAGPAHEGTTGGSTLHGGGESTGSAGVESEGAVQESEDSE